ncbi:hypothetical protein [Eikenella corrodens]|uniref:Uncharacterized protein n=1 Tax=Eikenella corrodens TaxID=539 RepID=A0A1A9RL40_EIKCO|nr:hypothetical protein [Eikenella corrodens]MDU4301336.1 hypothetical protein [Eikenella corrodens]OAM18862.1 hypothetical protein A7P90_06245 [Eikenella corrodens]OAM30948.1 hypothetical protein A7P93_05735 [Eikenella corrodens]
MPQSKQYGKTSRHGLALKSIRYTPPQAAAIRPAAACQISRPSGGRRGSDARPVLSLPSLPFSARARCRLPDRLGGLPHTALQASTAYGCRF